MKSTWKSRFVSFMKIAGMVVLLFIIASSMIFSIWRASFVSWTGFGDYVTPTGEFIRGKTIWDWLELLVIPLSLVVGGYLLNRSERAVERQIAEDRAKLEREIALDRQREAALQSYLDRMSDLLIKENPRISENVEARKVAKVRTLTVLRGLDVSRKELVLHFLYDAGLISNNDDDHAIDLEKADFSGVNLREAYLTNAYLPYVDFSKADLRDARLDGALLVGSKMIEANLAGAFLMGASLRTADLSNADLSNAKLNLNYLSATLSSQNVTIQDLEYANLGLANLSGANLRGAIVTDEQLATTESLKGATMPDGTIHE